MEPAKEENKFPKFSFDNLALRVGSEITKLRFQFLLELSANELDFFPP